MDLSLFFAGTGGSAPAARRGLPALLVRRGGDRMLFDCGEGTQRQLLRSVGLVDVDSVFITHFHSDHWLGLPGMLKSLALRERSAPLTVYGPRGLSELMGVMRIIYGRLPYALSVQELEPAEALQRDGYRVAAVPVKHGDRPAYGYVLVEDDRPGEFDPVEAERLGVRPGPDFGRLQRGFSVGGVDPERVMGAPRHGRKIVMSGDTAPCESLIVAAHQADVLVHEATFMHEEAERARETCHSTARQAAEVAREAEVRLLALTHMSSRYAGADVLAEAREVFAACEAPRDFDTIEIPFPERGAASFVRWSSRKRDRAERAADGAQNDAGGQSAAPEPVFGA
jgi:ribonuclease Z